VTNGYRSTSIRAIEESESYQNDETDILTKEEKKEADQLWRDEQLKRRDPAAYEQLQRDRQAKELAEASAAASKLPAPLGPGPSANSAPPKTRVPLPHTPTLNISEEIPKTDGFIERNQSKQTVKATVGKTAVAPTNLPLRHAESPGPIITQVKKRAPITPIDPPPNPGAGLVQEQSFITIADSPPTIGPLAVSKRASSSVSPSDRARKKMRNSFGQSTAKKVNEIHSTIGSPTPSFKTAESTAGTPVPSIKPTNTRVLTPISPRIVETRGRGGEPRTPASPGVSNCCIS
jgi:hypothetical protein